LFLSARQGFSVPTKHDGSLKESFMPTANLPSEPGLKRDAGRIGLLFASLSGMIGSGWLFGAFNAARIAGPASIFAWIIGGIAILLLAFVYAELTTMFPRPGAVIVFPKLCHGMLAAQVMSWINFLAYVAVAPVEAVAVVSYGNHFFSGLVVASSGVLTPKGLAAAVGLMLLFIVINLLAIRLLLNVNNAITLWKLAVPALTVVALILAHFRTANFTEYGFAPAGVAGIFKAVSGAGIIFTYLGFRQAIELAGESANPNRAMPFAILGSVLFCMLLYCGLQIAFIGALSPAALAKGWAALSFPGISGPFAGLASMLGLTWLAVLLYTDAAISPAGTGIIYNTTAARVIFATADEGLLHKRFARVSIAGVPVASLTLCFFVGLLFLLPLPSWRLLVTYLSSIGVLAYGVGPVVLICFRHSLPEAEYPRPFRLAYAGILASAAFMVANFVVFWAGAVVDDHLFGGLAAAFIVYICYQAIRYRGISHLDWRGAWWLAPYFTGLWLITLLGPPQLSHGIGAISGLAASLLIVGLSLCIIQLARLCAIADPVEAKARLTPRRM
jgi:amino acid transporter